MPPRKKSWIVEEEPIARERIRRLLANRPECDVHTAANGEIALEMVGSEKPDILFLDVQMPQIDGFALIERLGADRPPVIVFVTAFDEHALKAFDSQALDYLVKPFDDARFEASLSRAQAAVSQRRLGEAVLQLAELKPSASSVAEVGGGGEAATELELSAGLLERVLGKMRDRVKINPVRDIDWVAADGNYVRLYGGAEKPLYRSTLSEFESRLDPRKFVRIHRSAIVNLDRVLELRELSRADYVVILKSGAKLKLSRARRARLEQLLAGTL